MKPTAMAKEKGKFPEFKDLTPKGDDFEECADKLLSIVVGKNVFNKQKMGYPVSQICTLSDEAFLCVTLENAHDHWKAEWEHPDDCSKWPPKKHASNPAASTKCGGWNNEGRKRCNDLQMRVKLERMLSSRISKEEKHKDRKSAGWRNKKKRKRNGMTVDDDEDVPLIIMGLPEMGAPRVSLGATSRDSSSSSSSSGNDLTAV